MVKKYFSFAVNNFDKAATNQKLVHFIGPEIGGTGNIIEKIFNDSTGSNVISFPTQTSFESKLVLSPIGKV